MDKNNCIALGLFDSIHFGHRKIIQKLKEKSEELSAKPVVSTFSDSFCTYSSPKSKLVYTLEERKSILNKLGISDILVFEFDLDFKNRSPHDFFLWLKNNQNPKYLVCGYDYHFGKECSGDVRDLYEFCSNSDIQLEVVDKVCLEGDRVSTSRIKQLLQEGNLPHANKMLKEAFFVRGIIQKGRGEGQKNNFPTANIVASNQKLLPKNGVYATKTYLEGKEYNSVTNIGAKPTYNDYSFGIETHLIGYSGNIYGKEIQVQFYNYLRQTKHFDSKEELCSQISLDIKNALDSLSTDVCL